MTRRTSVITIHRILTSTSILALAASAAALFQNSYVALALGLPAFLLLPGFLTQLALRREVEPNLNNFLYAGALSIGYWILGGLGLNTLLPHIGILRPLQLAYILPFYLVTTTALTIWAWQRHKDDTYTLTSPVSNKHTLAAVIVSIMLPVASILGATSLNNGSTGAITIAMLGAIMAFIIYLAVSYKHVNWKIYPLVIFGIGLSLLLMYSMRSWYVIGWDINTELQVFIRTLSAERWQMSYYPGSPYNACLSLTVLPTILQKLVHLSPAYTFKLLYQIIFATVPLAIYAVAKRFLMPVLALSAAMLFVGQNWFFELMPALARQEIALTFFGVFIVALVDPNLSKSLRRFMLYIMSLGLVLSHYSSAYIWFILLAAAYAMLVTTRLASRNARLSNRGITWPLIVFGAAALFVWEVPLTSTASNIQSVAANLVPQVKDSFTPSTIDIALKSALAGPPPINTQANVTEAAKIATALRGGSASLYYPAQATSSYHAAPEDDTVHAANILPSALAGVLKFSSIVLKAIVSNVMTAVGITLVAIYFLRRNHKSNLDFIALCGAGYALIMAVLLLPYIQQAYNLTRLGLQVFMLLVIPATAGLWYAVRRNVRFGLPVIALITVILLSLQSGLLDQFTGGADRTTLVATSTPFDVQYTNTDEVYAAKWLAANRNPALPVYADPFANLRLESSAGFSTVYTSVLPTTISKDGYVYLIDINTIRGHSYIYLNNYSLIYNTPTDFLNRNKNLIYSSGNSVVYH
jgi:uncharacterized membrane protein